MIRNPDRDFSAGKLPREEQEELWNLLEREVAGLLEPAVCERFGRVISRAAFRANSEALVERWERCAQVQESTMAAIANASYERRRQAKPLAGSE